MNSCVNSPEDGPVGPKHVEIRRYMNKTEIVTSVGFSFHIAYDYIYTQFGAQTVGFNNYHFTVRYMEDTLPW